jgi:hypothetical protein
MTDAAGIPALQDAVRHLHGVESQHVETVHVREVHAGALVCRDGRALRALQLRAHPKDDPHIARDGRWRRTNVVEHRRACVGCARRGADMKPRKRGPGRPAFDDGTARTGVFTLRLSDEERAAIEAAAENAKKPVTQWARAVLLRAALSSGGSTE